MTKEEALAVLKTEYEAKWMSIWNECLLKRSVIRTK